MSDIQQEITNLRHQILQMDHAYWVLNDPIASDDDYDRAMKRLIELEQKHPQLHDALSPTMRFGGQTINEDSSQLHTVTSCFHWIMPFPTMMLLISFNALRKSLVIARNWLANQNLMD